MDVSELRKIEAQLADELADLNISVMMSSKNSLELCYWDKPSPRADLSHVNLENVTVTHIYLDDY